MKMQDTELRNVLNSMRNGFNFMNLSDKNNFFFRDENISLKRKINSKKTVLFILKYQKSSDTHIDFFFFFYVSLFMKHDCS